MKILITAATSAEAQRLKNHLGINEIILGDYELLPVFLVTSGKFIQLPNPGSASYAHEMLTLCLDHRIDAVYPLARLEKEQLFAAAQLFDEYAIKIVHSN